MLGGKIGGLVSPTEDAISTAGTQLAFLPSGPAPSRRPPRAPSRNPLLWALRAGAWWPEETGAGGESPEPWAGRRGVGAVPKATARTRGFPHPTPVFPVQQRPLRLPLGAWRGAGPRRRRNIARALVGLSALRQTAPLLNAPPVSHVTGPVGSCGHLAAQKGPSRG